MQDRLPLDGIRVLDLTQARAGPTATRQLADWGADVIKVEAPPDPARADAITGARDDSDFLNLHRNKRSMTLNLKHPEGRALFLRLAAGADVVAENFRPDVKHRLGIDYEAVRAVNRRIIYGSISGFGQDGPYQERPGVDQIAQGLGGLMTITGLPGQGPVRVGIPIADLCAGNFLAQGILLALLERERSGEGQWVHTSLLEALIAMLDLQAARWLVDADVPGQAGNDHPMLIPTGVFPTTDTPINIAAAGGVMFRRLCEAIGRPDLISHPDYRNSRLRSEHRVALHALIAEQTRTQAASHWVEALNAAGVPCGPIYRVDEMFADPQVQHLHMGLHTPHPTRGFVDLVAQPIHLERSGRPDRARVAAPALGEHTDAVLGDLGLDGAALAALRADGVI